MCVCVRTCVSVRVCVCECVCVRVRALKIVSMDKISRFTNTSVTINYYERGCGRPVRWSLTVRMVSVDIKQR